MNELRVLVVAEQLRRAVPGGIGTYVEGLVRGLRGLEAGGASFGLVASRTRAPDPLEDLGLPLEFVDLPSRVLVKAWDLGLARVGRGHSLVHATSLAVPAAAAPLVATVHDLAWRSVPEAYPRRGRRWHDAALARALRRAERFVVPAPAVAGELATLLGPGEAGRIAVIAYGADHLPDPDHAGARARLDRLGVHGGFLLSVGTLEPRKNLARLFAAYARARSELSEPWPLVVVGPSGWGATAEAPPEGVVLAGSVAAAELAALYASCRCLAYVPLLEGYGLPVAEAMRAGAPVVSSAVPSAGDAALLVDPLDVEEIASGLVAASTDGAARDQLRARGRAHTADMTWARTAAAHLALWRSIVARTP